MIENLWPISPARSPVRGFIDRFVHKLRVVPGYCNICGGVTVFDTSLSNYREHVQCFRCRSVNRQRQIAAVLLSEIFRSRSSGDAHFNIFNGPASQRLKLNHRVEQLASIESIPRDLTVWNAETTRALHARLAAHLNEKYMCSEFIDSEMRSGEFHEGVMHVDMQSTHFEPDSIDYILSGDVLEHVPDPIKALRESYRVLRPGGAHIFTVPFYHHRFTIERRSEFKEGEVRHLMKPWFHDDPVRPSDGALVFNVFAPELLCEIERIGFEARLLILHSPFHGIYGNNGIVIIARKSLSPDHSMDWIFGRP